ncbi:PREDICTED: uncharacterized protein LOC108572854 [Habropoda laboriosa]|uniref:uncharacterized protein LOC108572854 n=1 Tax=Habropoda laboriosa TaxID=597456 RepID=UPI00083D88AA|nr:PREDICTED: uncharacterized protein LOC108572854 [Habropoda laboriosa]
MSIMFLAMFLSSTIRFHVTCELFKPANTDSYSNLYPIVEKWASFSHTKMLTVVFDDYELEQTFQVPRTILNNLNISTKLVSLKHLISLKDTNRNRDYQTIESGSCVLLLFSDMDHLRDILSSPHLVSFWHPENFYLLQEQKTQISEAFDHERFCIWAFERLWRFRRVYKLLLFTGDKVIRYDPFDYAGRHAKYYVNSSCDWRCIKTNEDSFLIVNRSSRIDIGDFFEESQRRDFNSCPLKISIFKTSTMHLVNGEFTGFDYKYVEEVCRMMSVTPVLVRSKDKFGWEENGAYYGTLGHLVYEFADVSFNQFFVKDYLTRQMEFTTSITSDKLCVLVPKASPVPDYLVIIKIFREVFEKARKGGRELFCCEFLPDSYFLEDREVGTAGRDLEKDRYDDSRGVQTYETMRNIRLTWKTEMEETHSRRFNQIFLSHLASVARYLMKVVLQLMQPFESGKPWFPERLLLMCSLFLSLILNGVLTSQLASTFSKRMYYKDIDTLEELEESGLAILTNSRDVIDDALTDSTSPVINRLHVRLEYANVTEIHRRLFETKDAGYLHRLSTVTLKYDEHQLEKLHIVKECPKDYILANVMTKGSPFRGRINNVMARLNNGGFYGKWYQSLYQAKKRVLLRGTTMHRKITIQHLFIPFAILYVGLATSTIAFARECRRNNVG